MTLHRRSLVLGLCMMALFAGPGARGLMAAGTATLEVRLSGAVPTALVLQAADGSWSARVEPRDGRATFFDVPAGTYRMAVEPGRTAVVGLLPLGGDEIVRVAVDVVPGKESIAVLREEDRLRRSYGTVFGRDALRDLPTSGDAASLLETAEPLGIADRRDTGGLFPGEPGRTSVHGASWTETAVALGGVDLTEPRRGGIGLLDPDLIALQLVEAGSAALPAEVGGSGLVLGLTPRLPGSVWTGEAEVDAALDSGEPRGGVAPPIARLLAGQAWRLAAGGPLVRDRLGLFVAGAWRRARRAERASPTELTSERAFALGHLVWGKGPRTQARLLGLGEWLEAPSARLGSSILNEGTHLGGAHFQLALTQRSRGGAVATLQAGLTRGQTRTPPAERTRTIERLIDGPVLDQPSPGRDRRGVSALELALALPALRWAAVTHQLRFGLAAEGASDRASPFTAVELVAESLAGRPARLWERRTAGSTRWSSSTFSAYASDRLQAGRLDLEGGLRAEALRAAADSAPERIRWLDLAPRLTARVRLGPAGLSLIAGYARYLHRLPLETLAWGDPSAPYTAVYRWDERQRDLVFQPDERGPLVAFSGPGAPIGSLDPDLVRPRTDEFLVVLEARLREHVVARFAAIDRETRRLLESVNLRLSPADERVLLVNDPGGDFATPDDDQLLPIHERLPSGFGRDLLLLTNPPGHDARHQGLELSLEATTARFGLWIGATAHRSDGQAAYLGFRPEENDQGRIGELFDQPNADQFARGRLFSDRAYTIKVAGAYRAPGRLRIGAVARYQDGQPFARLVVVPGLGQGTDAVRAVPNGRHRFAYTLTVDGRVELEVPVGRGRLGAVLEAFNLLGTAHEVEEDVVTGPGFRTATAIQPPRVLRAGLRLEF